MSPLLRRFFDRFPALPIGTFIGILHLLIAILGAGIITAFSLYFIYQSGEQATLREMENLAFTVNHALEQPAGTPVDGSGSPFTPVTQTLDESLRNRPDVRYALLGLDGRPLLTGAASRSLTGTSGTAPEVRAALAHRLGQAIRLNPQGQRTIYVATAIDHSGVVQGTLVLAAPLDQAMEPTYRIMRWMSVIALLIVLFTVAEGWLGSVYISRPLVRLSRVAEQLSQGDMTARADPRGPTEVIHLALTLNEMAGRVQNSLESLRAFVANASHELRTPLTSIKLQVEALRSAAADEPEVADRFMDQVDGEIDRLVHTVNDMLDLSQLEGGGSRPELQAVNLTELAGETQAFWEARSRQAGLLLTLDAEPDLPEVKGDPYQLRRLLDNLLDNAIKYTPTGGEVKVTLRRCLPLTGSRLSGWVRIEVCDTGVGIEPEFLPRLFDRFYRIEAHPRTGRPNGSGLGLAIARSIVNAHSGRIGVNSLVGQGSTFWVELPVF